MNKFLFLPSYKIMLLCTIIILFNNLDCVHASRMRRISNNTISSNSLNLPSSLSNNTQANSKIIINQPKPQHNLAGDKAVKKFVKHETESNHVLIRVLLNQQTASDKLFWNFKSSEGFIIASPENKKDYHIKSTKITLLFKNNKLLINNRVYPYNDIMIIPYKNHHIEHNNNNYHGTFLVSLNKNSKDNKSNTEIYLVNYVDIEDYVLSVLPSESWPGWPEEVNKVFCICFRTYALSKILEQRNAQKRSSTKAFYDIKNTNIHQTYKGFNTKPVFRAAVDQTRGLILAYKNKPIVAMFDSCCGGVMPSKLSGVNFNHAPYLERFYSCSYCKDCFLYAWNKELTLKNFQEKLKINDKARIQDVKITKKDTAGKVCEVKIKKNNIWVAYSGKQFYSFFPEIKSFCYTIEKKGQKIILKGKGYGHHLGLCQWGAYAMVKQNWEYQNILKFYYPHTSLMKLQAKEQENI